MEAQSLINVGFALAGALGAFILKAVWDGLRDLRNADQILADKVQSIEILVAGSYVTWDGMKDVIRPITDTLNRIESKLDGKADKVHQ